MDGLDKSTIDGLLSELDNKLQKYIEDVEYPKLI